LAPEGVIAFCRGRIGELKIPRHVFVVDELPMTVERQGAEGQAAGRGARCASAERSHLRRLDVLTVLVAVPRGTLSTTSIAASTRRVRGRDHRETERP